jgi:hypothetical protein
MGTGKSDEEIDKIIRKEIEKHIHTLIALAPHDRGEHVCSQACLVDIGSHSGSEKQCPHPECVAWRARFGIATHPLVNN